MKKIFLVLCALCATTVINAQNFLNTVSGSVLEVKEADKANVIIEWDYSNHTIDNQPTESFFAKKGEEAKKQFLEEVQESQESFAFYLRSKYLTPVLDKSIAKYVLRVKIMNYDSNNNLLTCGLEFCRINDTEPFAVFESTPIPGVGDIWNASHVKNAYILLALSIRKTIKKAK